MKDQDEDILDDILDTNNKDPKPDTWETGFQKEIHALVTVADANEDVGEGGRRSNPRALSPVSGRC